MVLPRTIRPSALTPGTSSPPLFLFHADNTLMNPSPGTIGLKVSDGFSAPGAVTLPWWIPTLGGYNWWDHTPSLAFVSSARARGQPNAQGNASSGLFYSAYTDGAAAPAFGVGYADAFGDNTTGGAGAAWAYAPGANGSVAASMLPPTNPDSNLRIGSSSTPSATTSWSFDGDLFYVLFYREAHGLAQQQQVQAFMRTYMVSHQCDQPLQITSDSSAASVYLADRCVTTPAGVAYGYGAQRCYMSCNSGYQWYM